MPEPVQPPAAPTTPDFSEISKSIEALTGLVGGINERLSGFEEQIAGLTVKPEPEPPVEGEWVPKKWDEFPKKAEEVALSVWEKKEVERQAQVEAENRQASDLKVQIDKDFDTQLEKLEKEGTIPAVKDVKSDNDPGKMARKELFALGIKYNSPDLVAMAQLRNDYISAGYSFDVKEGKLIKSNPRPFGADAPVGSSARSSTSANKPSYKEIHGLSIDEMVRRANQ